MKKSSGFIAIDLSLAIVAVMILFIVVGGSTVGSIQRSVNDSNTKSYAGVIDHALSIWYYSHGNVYPMDLTSLQNMGYIQNSIPVASFTYTTRNSQTEYSLTIPLKNGGTYKSIGSKY